MIPPLFRCRSAADQGDFVIGLNFSGGLSSMSASSQRRSA
jgi:hypothetical protein